MGIGDYATYQAKRSTETKPQRPGQKSVRGETIRPKAEPIEPTAEPMGVIEADLSDTFIGKMRKFWESHG
jgi:hypothetical protein